MKQAINSPQAPAAIGPYSQAIAAGGFLYVSGQLPVDGASGGIPPSIEEQTKNSLANIDAILKHAGYARNDVVKVTVFLADMGDFAAMNRVYGEFFEGCVYPARAAFQVARLPKDALVEIEAVAFKGGA
ncbi:MAG: RidA family protein [Spirochaetaceae bacterium]|jgi:2-iminobutanoate/2-iminopropanoate deaminase|nr:RidA family protein [Spirochaetaceae bacterium]